MRPRPYSSWARPRPRHTHTLFRVALARATRGPATLDPAIPAPATAGRATPAPAGGIAATAAMSTTAARMTARAFAWSFPWYPAAGEPRRLPGPAPFRPRPGAAPRRLPRGGRGR